MISKLMPKSFFEKIEWTLIAVLGISFVVFFVNFLSDYNHWSVMVHSYEIHLPRMATEGPSLKWTDWMKPLQELDTMEHRPRFIAYAIVMLDFYLRFLIYPYFVLLPFIYIPTVILLLALPLCIYRWMIHLTNDKQASALATLVLVTSINFMSSFTMILQASKPLTLLSFAWSLLLLISLKNDAKERQLFFEIPSCRKIVLWFVLFFSLFLDEIPVFLFLLLPLVFQEIFFVKPTGIKSIRRMISNLAVFGSPFIVFILLVIFIVPLITKAFYGYQFDYLGTLLTTGKFASTGKSFFASPSGSFGWESLWGNLTTLLGLSLMPWQISHFTSHPGSGVYTGLAMTWPLLATLAIIFGGIIVLAFRLGGQKGIYLRRLLVGAGLFILFISILHGRHVPRITGYYYGGPWAIFVASFVGICFAAMKRLGHGATLLAIGMVAWICAIQIYNFIPINRSYISVYNALGYDNHQSEFHIEKEMPLTKKEVETIWSFWKKGKLQDYLDKNKISPGSLFLVYELRWLDLHPRSR